MTNEFINDGTYKCDTCGLIFKVYALNDEPDTSFCSSCSSPRIDEYKELEEEE